MEVDVRRMEQVVKNLISNAPKHAKTCEISLRLFYNSNNDQVTFAVTDGGQGFSEEDLPFIFDRFYTKTNQQSSHGLGYLQRNH